MWNLQWIFNIFKQTTKQWNNLNITNAIKQLLESKCSRPTIKAYSHLHRLWSSFDVWFHLSKRIYFPPLYLMRNIFLLSKVAMLSCSGVSPLSATCSGVFFTLFWACRFTFFHPLLCVAWPQFTSLCTTSWCPPRTAQCRGVSLLWSVALIFAPASSSSAATLSWPFSAAAWSGVLLHAFLSSIPLLLSDCKRAETTPVCPPAAA